MDRFEEVVDFLAGYSPQNCSLNQGAFEQLKEMMSSYLDLEDLVGQSEMVLSRMFEQSKLAFMRAGFLIKKDRNLLADLELIEGFIDHIDKSHTKGESNGRELQTKRVELEQLDKECTILRSTCDNLTQRCSAMHSELNAVTEDLKYYKAKCEELELDLERTRTNSTDTVDHFHSLYNTAVKENMNFAKKNSQEVIGLTAQRDQLEREVANLKLELEETISSHSSNGLKLSLAEGELVTLRAEYSMLKEKYFNLNQEHTSEVKAYQAEIEDLNFKLIDAKKSMRRQDSLNLSEEDHGLDEKILGENFLAVSFPGEDLDRDRYSQSSTGSRPCKVKVDQAFIKKDRRYSKRNSLVSANQNTTINNSIPSIIQQKPPEVDKEIIDALRATIDSLKKDVFTKEFEIEELRLQVSNSQGQLSEIMNEFTDEIISKDKTIALLKRSLRAMQTVVT